MNESNIHSNRPRFFDPDMAEVASFHHRSKIYESHLKQVRTFLWIALAVFSVLFYWYGEANRYTHAKDLMILDTKTGWIYNHKGDRIGK
ncbi:hypothetical protein J2X69_002683 [Algoriphagus sp. 4150]|uniref:hypothetical protein n=1 Tax=Algoriphagus sp. 4150 TaxID=2817756 RepID=UPI00285AD981|nr:hypothetical protein [Algoriphagus sp. 4150]MDR7130333.1 hypothetical protein [Algoriphagus sp. 4150]